MVVVFILGTLALDRMALACILNPQLTYKGSYGAVQNDLVSQVVPPVHEPRMYSFVVFAGERTATASGSACFF